MNISELPEYKKDQLYNLGYDKVKAQAGLDYINSFCPVLNMERWAEKLSECLDGYYRIPRIPTCRIQDAISKGSFTQADVMYFIENYIVSIDECDVEWFPQPEMEV